MFEERAEHRRRPRTSRQRSKQLALGLHRVLRRHRRRHRRRRRSAATGGWRGGRELRERHRPGELLADLIQNTAGRNCCARGAPEGDWKNTRWRRSEPEGKDMREGTGGRKVKRGRGEEEVVINDLYVAVGVGHSLHRCQLSPAPRQPSR